MQSSKLQLKFKNFLYKYWAVFWIVAVWFIFGHPYFLKGLVPFPSRYLVDFFSPWNNYFGMPVKNNAMPDVITQIYPWKKIVIDSWKNGQIPFWNPYQFAGNPLLANFQSASFTPFNLLFFILPFIEAWSLLILLQPLLAGLFMYLFMREIKISKVGSLIASISFMFAGFITVWMAYGTLSYAVLYLPLLLYGIERYFNRQDKIGASIIVISIPLSFFSGHFQTSLYFLMTGIFYILFKYLRTKQYKYLISNIKYLIIGLLFSLPQLIPSIQLYQQSVRKGLFRTGEVIPWNYLITAIAPDFFGNPVTRNDWFGHYAEWASFVGTISIVLVFTAILLRKKSEKAYFFIFLGLFSLLLAFNTPLVDLMVKLKIPVLSTSAASRIIILFSFTLAVLAGFGLDCVKRDLKISQKKRILFIAFWVVFTVLIWILLLSGNLLFAKHITPEKLYVAKRNFILPTLIISTGLGLISIWMFSNKLIKDKLWRKRVRQFLIFSFLFLISFDMLRFAQKWMPFDEREFVYPEIEVLDYLKEHKGNYRVFGNIGNEALAPFGLQGIEGYDPLYPERYGEFIRTVYDGNKRPAERSVVKLDKNGEYTKKILDLLGVRYILHSKGDGHNVWAFPFWEFPESFGSAVWSDEKYEIYENTRAFPRAFLVYTYKVANSDQGIIDIMFDKAMDLSKLIVLEKKPAIDSLAIELLSNRTIINKVEIVKYTPNKVEIKVQTNYPGLLFLSDNYYPGWNAYVNDKKTNIYRANYTFRAVEVPKGKSTVRFAYENWYF